MTSPRVLVVEDDPDLRDALCGVLAAEPFEPVPVKSADEALDYLVFQQAPAAVILDLRLPGELNGWDLLQWMRRDSDLKGVPVVVVSGAPLERVELTLDHAPRACLLKPFDPAALLAHVRDAVAGPW
ncbi:MAG: response regulator transcription factor [Planctomycetes bacterium]|nr:response regulator transcription factor [Planctomycetota bacterium]